VRGAEVDKGRDGVGVELDGELHGFGRRNPRDRVERNLGCSVIQWIIGRRRLQL
jgi:hypothetical protein